MPGFKTLLEGATGTGKTYALRSLIDCGITPFIISTEPGVEANLGDLPEDKVHWRYIPASTASWDSMISNATKIHTLSFEALTKMKEMEKKQYGQFLEVLTTCANFTCDRTGDSYGCVDNWGTDRALVVDSLSGLNIMAMDLVVGAKPVKSVGDWGVAMDNLERFINRCCFGISTHFILIAHLEREKDEVSGAIKNMTSTLGNKLAPKVPRYFDDVVMAKRQVDSFMWSTADTSTDVKTRYLEISDKLLPSFEGIFKGWQAQGGKIEPTPPLTAAA